MENTNTPEWLAVYLANVKNGKKKVMELLNIKPAMLSTYLSDKYSTTFSAEHLEQLDMAFPCLFSEMQETIDRIKFLRSKEINSKIQELKKRK